MRFSLGSVFLFVTGVALVTFAGTLSSHFLVTAFAFLLMIVGANWGRRRFWVSASLAALCGALGVWLGLLFHAFVMPWSNLPGVPYDAMRKEAYQQFVRDTFISQSAFGLAIGAVCGGIVATLLWGIKKIMARCLSVPS